MSDPIQLLQQISDNTEKNNSTIANVLVEIVNNGVSNIDCSYQANLTSSLLQHPQNYQVALTRLNLPTSAIELLNITDRSKYMVGIKFGGGTTYTTQLPNYSSNGIRYYTREQIIEHINRSFLSSFYQRHITLGLSYYPRTGTQTSTITNASPVASGTITTGITYCAGGFLKLTGFTVNSGSTSNQMKLYLVSPGATPRRVNVFVGSATELSSLLSKSGGELYINENSFNDKFDNITPTNNSLKSYESMLTFSDDTEALVISGSWSFAIEMSGSFSFAFTWELFLYCSDRGLYEGKAPYVSVINDKLAINLENNHIRNGNLIGFSPYLSDKFTFFQERSLYDSSSGLYLHYPNAIIITDLKAVSTTVQETSTYFALQNIANVRIRSSNLSGSDSEILITNLNQVLPGNIISDLAVDTDVTLGNELQFSITDKPFRLISLKHLTTLQLLDLLVEIAYSDGTTKIAQITPGRRCQLRISFFPIE